MILLVIRKVQTDHPSITEVMIVTMIMFFATPPGSKFKTTRFSAQDDKHHRGNRGRGDNTLPAYSLLHITCNCDDTDVDTMYRTCCITTGNSPSSLFVTTLFDTGANPTSFVNRQAAAWIES
jgi:hypothetical protein